MVWSSRRSSLRRRSEQQRLRRRTLSRALSVRPTPRAHNSPPMTSSIHSVARRMAWSSTGIGGSFTGDRLSARCHLPRSVPLRVARGADLLLCVLLHVAPCAPCISTCRSALLCDASRHPLCCSSPLGALLLANLPADVHLVVLLVALRRPGCHGLCDAALRCAPLRAPM